MAASSVTGVGMGRTAPHHHLGVTHLIGPSWYKDKEDVYCKLQYLRKQLKTYKNILLTLAILQTLTIFGMIGLFFYVTR